ncbi:XrtA-associated tyrosine autokinase [Glaciecola sp. 1036]|uniref:XrtA-associated tyrosine autokinase n=1 Tax=Alteromonadaceae TaxID=72275 RepID=UPI003D0183FC
MKSTIEKALQMQKAAKAKQTDELENQKENDQLDTASSDDKDTSSALESSKEVSTSSEAPTEIEKPQEADSKSASDVELSTAASETRSKVDNENSIEAPSPVDNFYEIDLARLESLGFVTTTDARRRINEEYREIKRKLLLNAFGPLSKTMPNSNIIMVTSARPSEGKTFTAVNLALSIAAEQDKTVLLVDADVLKPNVLRTLGLEAKKGLMDYLLEDEPLSKFIYRTNVDKLRLIPAGSSHHLSTELLASDAMHATVNEFSTRYPDRIVIIDTPPIIGINESAILASFAGQAVVVAEEGRSKLSDIQNAVERLNPEMAVGFVMNKSISTSDSAGYYGYYYYGHEPEKE